MATFLVIYQQNGGCDYTIGCGINFVQFEAVSFSAARKRVEHAYLSDGEDGDPDNLFSHNNTEGTFDVIQLFEILRVTPLEVEDLDAQLAQRMLNEENAAAEARERAEFERLNKKFGKTKKAKK